MKLATLSTADVRANSLQKQNEYLQVVFKKFERENANLKADVSSKNDQLELDKFQIFQITGPNPWVRLYIMVAQNWFPKLFFHFSFGGPKQGLGVRALWLRN